MLLLALSACMIASAPPPPPPEVPPPPPGGNSFANPDRMSCDQIAPDRLARPGMARYVSCPPCAQFHQGVWGSDFFTDDSAVCAASVHAGALDRGGGIALVTWVTGQSTHIGSERNGIKSFDYGARRRSFYVQRVDDRGQPTSPPP